MLRQISKLIEPVRRSIRLAIGRCVIEAVKDSSGLQTLKVSLLDGEIKELERVQEFGFTSSPPVGSEGVCVFVGGTRSNGICIATDDRRYRVKTEEGQTAIYDQSGAMVFLKNDGTIELGQGVMEKILLGETFQTFFNAHTHTGNLGVLTSPPTTPSSVTELSQTIKTGA